MRRCDREPAALGSRHAGLSLDPEIEHDRAVSYYMRYFADAPLALDSIKAGLSAEDPRFKIDGGEITRGTDLLAEIEINRPGSDLFDDELAKMSSQLQAVQSSAAGQVLSRVRTTQALLALQVVVQARTQEQTMELLGPLWTVLQSLANGLWHVDGQGFFDGGQLVVAV
ncbi:MAG: hypothetical protein H6Q90_4540 [Deltaproteobacteria bacterium]|nr:hypothetical protein [Deltaproteobacteria bacterium]